MIKIGYFLWLTVLGAGLLLCGCSAPRVTETGRTAVEQFLISTVVENGIGHADFEAYSGKKIFIDYEYLAPQVDKAYVQGVFEMHLAKEGLTVCRDVAEADYIVHTTRRTSGLSIPIPKALVDTITRALSFFQASSRLSFTSGERPA